MEMKMSCLEMVLEQLDIHMLKKKKKVSMYLEANLGAWTRSREADNIPSLKLEVSRAILKGSPGKSCPPEQVL